MKTLLTITPLDFNDKENPVDVDDFRLRFAARAVVLDEQGRVHLLHVRNFGCHKLPGGGVQNGEDIKKALERELREEIGCTAEILADIGQIVEYRDYEEGGLKQTSLCYLAKQIGDPEDPQLEPDEIADGMVPIIAKNIDETIELLRNDTPINTEGLSIQKRDLCFLRAARDAMKPLER